jgi:serine/threonine-protein kinase
VALAPGTRLGPYEVIALIGMGGMGEVYRARDSKLNRDVALKILPDAFTLDGDRIARFRREAQVLASLNHPNIAAIYGFEDSGSTHALVLELVEGPTLADRIAKGPIPLDEVLPIAKQIAEALEAAHEQGIIHRDLKPANIKLRDDGTVKVLDFGLAKAMEPLSTISPALTHSPTITSPALMTGVGMLLGTAAYMSPEQAKGRPADKRSDIWAFGCVLFEMLTGKRAFEGEDVSETLAAVLRGTPDWNVLSPNTPRLVSSFLQRCFVKDLRHRNADIAVARFVIDQVTDGKADAPAAAASHRWAARHLLIVAVAAATAGSVLTGAVAWWSVRPNAIRPIRVSIATMGPGAFENPSNNVRGLTISPDGTRVVYPGNRGTQLFVRGLDQLDSTALTTPGAPRGAFFSPDGEWVAYVESRVLKKVSLRGGLPATICPLPEPGAAFGTWGEDNTIILGGFPGGISGLWKVDAAGGTPVLVLRPDPTRGERAFTTPHALPNGHSVLLTVLSTNSPDESAKVVVLDLRTGMQKMLVRGSDARYLNGYLVFSVRDTIEAVRFNEKRLEIVGAPVPVLRQVALKASGVAEFDVSGDGTAVYLPGGNQVVDRRLVWVDRQGHEEPIHLPPNGFQIARLSPDGRRLALDINDGRKRDIWIWDVQTERLQRLTNDALQDVGPVWMPDSRRLIFSVGPPGRGNLVWQVFDGSAPAEPLTHSPHGQYASAITSDFVIFREENPPDTDLMIMGLNPSRQPRPLLKTPFAELNGEVSPNGRWLAYEANDSSRVEVYVRPFPDVNASRTLVSTNGGSKPVWTRDGKELLYVEGETLMSVAVVPGNDWNAAKPKKQFETPYFYGSGGNRNFDISADGQRFLMIKETAADDSPNRTVAMVVVLNWTEELKQRVPVR